MIKITNLNISYHDKVLFTDSELTIEKGHLTAISGKSGSGKTTLFYILGLISGLRGYQYSFDGKEIDLSNEALKASMRKHKIGFIFQDKNLHEYLSIEDNMKLYCLISGQSYVRDEAIYYLKRVGLKQDLHTKTETLSGGERQRLAIACALMKNPDLIIADEPTSAIDNHNARLIVHLLKDIAAQGKMVIIATHNSELLKECEVIYYIKDHKLISNHQETKLKTDDPSDVDNKVKLKTFYPWYTSFQFGKSNFEKRFFMIIPAFIISLCLLSISVKDSLIHQYQGSLNEYSINEVFIEGQQDISDQAIQLLNNIEGVADNNQFSTTEVTQFTLDEISYEFDEPITIAPYYPYQEAYFRTIYDDNHHEVFITAKLADKLSSDHPENIEIDSHMLNGNSLKISGIFQQDYRLTQTPDTVLAIYIPNRYFVYDQKDKVLLKLDTFENFTNISDKIHEINSTYKTFFSQDKYISQMANLSSYTEHLNNFIFILIGMIILLLSFSQYFTVHNQKYEISILRANGLSKKEILFTLSVYMIKQILKTTCFVCVFALMAKLISYSFGFNLMISLSLCIIGFLIILFTYLIPGLLLALLILRIDIEKMLRF